MGGLLSRFRKSKTTVEILEDIDKQILSLEKHKKTNEDLRAWVVYKIYVYSAVLYISSWIGLYLYGLPIDLVYQVSIALLAVLFPFLIVWTNKVCHWWFVRKSRKNELQLKEFRDQRKEILENVKETEPYKRALEILEKFDPETKKKLEEEKRKAEMPVQVMMSPAGQELRRRTNANPSGDNTPAKPLNQMVRSPQMTPHGNRGVHMVATPGVNNSARRPALPRPILPRDRTAMTKIVEYFVGDGPANRFALICENCYSHNGMALAEEFEYLPFKCAYCGFYNKARKQKPGAPSLSQMRVQQLQSVTKLPPVPSIDAAPSTSSLSINGDQEQSVTAKSNDDNKTAMTSSTASISSVVTNRVEEISNGNNDDNDGGDATIQEIDQSIIKSDPPSAETEAAESEEDDEQISEKEAQSSSEDDNDHGESPQLRKPSVENTGDNNEHSSDDNQTSHDENESAS